MITQIQNPAAAINLLRAAHMIIQSQAVSLKDYFL